MREDRQYRVLFMGMGVGAILFLSGALFYSAQATASQGADEVNVNAVYITWWYVIGTSVAVLVKTLEGIVKYVPPQQFSFRKLLMAFAVTLPFLAVVVFFFLPKLGPPTNVPMKDVWYALVTAYTIIGIGSSHEDYRKYIVYVMDRLNAKKENK